MAVVVDGFTDTIGLTYAGGGKTIAGKSGSYNGTKVASCSEVIPAGAVNLEIDIAFPITTLQSIVIDSSQNLTIKTNSTGSPGDTIALKGTIPIMWGIDFVQAMPLTAAVTKLYVSNAGAVDSKFDVRALYN